MNALHAVRSYKHTGPGMHEAPAGVAGASRFKWFGQRWITRRSVRIVLPAVTVTR